MSVDEYCEICGKSAKQALETQSEREKELIRNAFDFGRRSVIMEIMDYFGFCCTYHDCNFYCGCDCPFDVCNAYAYRR